MLGVGVREETAYAATTDTVDNAAIENAACASPCHVLLGMSVARRQRRAAANKRIGFVHVTSWVSAHSFDDCAHRAAYRRVSCYGIST